MSKMICCRSLERLRSQSGECYHPVGRCLFHELLHHVGCEKGCTAVRHMFWMGPKFGEQNPCPFWVIIPPVNPLDDYSYTPPYTSPAISPLVPHYQDQYRNNRLPHPYKRIIPIPLHLTNCEEISKPSAILQ